MNIKIMYKPAHSLAHVTLNPGEKIIAESGAMVSMSPTLDMETSMGGVKKGLKRLFGGETLFRNTFTATRGPGEVLLAPALCGDMVTLDVAPKTWFIQSSSYVACSTGVELDTKVGGFKTFFGGEGLFVLKASGQGQCVVGAFGAIEKIEIDGSLVIDTGHLVAWEESPDLTFKVGKASSGWIASFLSGEGLVCKFKGRGTVWIQTRNPAEYGATVGRLLPPR